MKRRNREQRARMRTIQEFHMTKAYQRAMDLLCRKYGWSYSLVYKAYQKVSIPIEHTFNIINPTISKREENGICRIDITGQVPNRKGLEFTFRTAYREEIEP